MISATLLSRIRLVGLSATGVVCLAFGGLALILDRPDPFSPWIPLVVGIAAALTIMVAALLAGDRNADIATDELYFSESRRAQILGFWVAVGMYPLFGLAIGYGWITYPVAFSAMGTFTAAAFLLTFSVLNLKGSV
ncbi:MAG: hypothetical protein AAFQ79_07230 [Pseudomonadota bacterium]